MKPYVFEKTDGTKLTIERDTSGRGSYRNQYDLLLKVPNQWELFKRLDSDDLFSIHRHIKTYQEDFDKSEIMTFGSIYYHPEVIPRKDCTLKVQVLLDCGCRRVLLTMIEDNTLVSDILIQHKDIKDFLDSIYCASL